MHEKTLLKKLIPLLKQGKDIVCGPGDDCAIIDVGNNKLFLMAADQVISDVHYDKSKTPVADIAKKLINRNISDIAAMGGTPAHAILTIANSAKNEEWYIDFFTSIAKIAEKYKISVCGGDLATLSSTQGVCTLTITGWVDKNNECLRSNAKAEQYLYATGVFGNSYNSNHHINFIPRLDESKFLAGKYTNTMIDVSDGLLIDAQRIAIASNLGIELDIEKIPLRKNANIADALTDGEDYELLFAVAAEKTQRLESLWNFKNTQLSKIGIFTKNNIGKIYDKNQNILTEKYSGYDHYQ